jgi:hypothetical protein
VASSIGVTSLFNRIWVMPGSWFAPCAGIPGRSFGRPFERTVIEVRVVGDTDELDYQTDWSTVE